MEENRLSVVDLPETAGRKVPGYTFHVPTRGLRFITGTRSGPLRRGSDL